MTNILQYSNDWILLHRSTANRGTEVGGHDVSRRWPCHMLAGGVLDKAARPPHVRLPHITYVVMQQSRNSQT